MKIWKVRRRVYQAGRMLGDMHAATTGRIAQRIVRRTAWRLISRLLGKVFRRMRL